MYVCHVTGFCIEPRFLIPQSTPVAPVLISLDTVAYLNNFKQFIEPAERVACLNQSNRGFNKHLTHPWSFAAGGSLGTWSATLSLQKTLQCLLCSKQENKQINELIT